MPGSSSKTATIPRPAAKSARSYWRVADMTLVEPMTRRPDLYSRLEVEDPGKGKSTLLTLKGKSGTVLARLIVGKRRYDRLGAGNDGVYVRKPGDPQSWLARGSLDFSDTPANWLDRGIVDLPDSRVAKVSLTQPDGSTLVLEPGRAKGEIRGRGRAGKRQIQGRDGPRRTGDGARKPRPRRRAAGRQTAGSGQRRHHRVLHHLRRSEGRSEAVPARQQELDRARRDRLRQDRARGDEDRPAGIALGLSRSPPTRRR